MQGSQPLQTVMTFSVCCICSTMSYILLITPTFKCSAKPKKLRQVPHTRIVQPLDSRAFRCATICSSSPAGSCTPQFIKISARGGMLPSANV